MTPSQGRKYFKESANFTATNVEPNPWLMEKFIRFVIKTIMLLLRRLIFRNPYTLTKSRMKTRIGR